jgi:hypothetical protein
MAKICPDFPFDRAQEAGLPSLGHGAQGSGYLRGIFTWATRRFSKQRELMDERTRG